jgi:hypothetical protein
MEEELSIIRNELAERRAKELAEDKDNKINNK